MPRIAQRGFAFLTLLPYLLGFLAVAGVVGTAVHKVKAWGAAEVTAELQPQIDQCQGELTKANDAAKALKADGDRRVAEATKGVARARREAAGAISEAQRLRTASKTNAAPSACIAADAATELRKGLK